MEDYPKIRTALDGLPQIREEFRGKRGVGLDSRAGSRYNLGESGEEPPEGGLNTMNKVKDLSEMPEAIGGVSSEERGTIIRKDYMDGLAHICTTDFVEYGRLMKRCRQCPGVWRAVGYETNAGQPQVGYFEGPAKRVKYAAPRPKMSEEQRAAAMKRLGIAPVDADDADEDPEEDGD